MMPGGTPIITPEIQDAVFTTSSLPVKIGCRQFNTPSYPCRPLYKIDYNADYIRRQLTMIGRNTDHHYLEEVNRLNNLMPFTIGIQRVDYENDKETLEITSITGANNQIIPNGYFSLQIQSISEVESHWLDTGIFTNLA
jgi:hypothetical protein